MAFWSRKKQEPAENHSPNNTMFVHGQHEIDEATIAGCFKKYFILITGLLSESPYKKVPVVPELFACMTSILDFISDYYDFNVDSDRKEIASWFMAPFNSSMTKRRLSSFISQIEERRAFYLNHTIMDPLRAEFMLNEISSSGKNWPPYHYRVIFCDCVYNPECIKDYYKAPVLVSGIFDMAEQSALWSSIMDSLNNYTNAIKSFGL